MLEQLHGARFCVNAKKSKVDFKELDYFGYMVGRGQLRPQKRKVNAITKASQPHTKKQLWQFLSHMDHYSHFIPNVATMAAPLTSK